MVTRRVASSFEPNVDTGSVGGVVISTVGTTGVDMCSVDYSGSRLCNVNAAIIYTVIVRRVTCVTRTKSDETCVISRKTLARLAHSRSIIRRLIRRNGVATLRTGERPGGGVVAHTINIDHRVLISFDRRRVGSNSILLLYASNLAGFIRSSRVYSLAGSSVFCRFTRQLISETGGGKNNSGIAIMTIACWGR